VIAFDPISRNGPAATRVWGQADFASNGANQIKPGSINSPFRIVVDYSREPYALYVSDTNNHRVLGWKDAIHLRNGDPADLVIGQPDFRTAIANVDTRGSQTPSPTSLAAPKGLAVDGSGNLYVADSGNNRVLRFPRPAAQSGRITPDAVLGQPNFTSAASAAVNASSLNAPAGLAMGPDGSLFVADAGNHRVLQFPPGAGTGAEALRVYGQPGFTTGTTPGAVSAVNLAGPQGLAVDSAFNVYVCDSSAQRVLVFSNAQNQPAAGASASLVLGQDSFDTTTGGSGTRFNNPADVAVNSAGNIYVSDTGNQRVLSFSPLSSLIFAPPPILASGVVGQRDTSSAAPNWNSQDGLATPEGLFNPLGLFVDRRDTLYVGDAGNSRVVQFLKPAAAANAATSQAGVPVARSSLAALYGPGLAGPDTSQVTPGVPWPFSMGGREVVVNDDLRAALHFVGTNQINFQVPSATPAGSARIAVRVAETGELLAGGTMLVGGVSPGLFSLTQDGKGQAAVLNQDNSVNGPDNPAARGSVITLFGTGQGDVTPAVADGAAGPGGTLAHTVAAPTSDGNTCLNRQPSMCVAIGSTFGEVQFSGLAPGFVGLCQINVKLPGNALTGSVPVRAVVNGTPSNIVTVAIK
jgi:uncharacterized protein (TIGR03437 family)